jgi:hypothetical protein
MNRGKNIREELKKEVKNVRKLKKGRHYNEINLHAPLMVSK